MADIRKVSVDSCHPHFPRESPQKGLPAGNDAGYSDCKITFRYADVFFYNRLYQPAVFRNFFLKSGISCVYLILIEKLHS